MLDFKLFCKELRTVFGNPDEVATAECHLYALRQKGSVTSHVTEFMRHSIIVKWNDQARSAQFYRGLEDLVKDEISCIGRPHEFKELQGTAIRFDTRLFERHVEKGEQYLSANFTQDQPRFVPWPATTFTKTQTYSCPSKTLRATFQPSSTTKQGKLTPTEYQRCKDNNPCLYCGEKDHTVSKCPRHLPPTINNLA